MSITQTITPFSGDAPNSNNQTEGVFDNKANLFAADIVGLVPELNTWATQANATKDEINQLKLDTGTIKDQAVTETTAIKDQAATETTAIKNQAQAFAGEASNFAALANNYAQVAQSVANFVGDWADQSGTATVPTSVYHNGRFWALRVDVANISANTPSDASNVWALIQSVDIVRVPVLITPLSGATGVSPQPLLEADSYANVYSFARDYREFQVDLATGDFSLPVYTFSGDVDTHTVTTTLNFNEGYKWRCRDVAVDGTAGRWSAVAVFNTGAVTVAQPTLTVDGSPSDVPETPTLTTSAFAVIGGTDTHLNTDWQILDDQLQVVWESLADSANKLSIVVPAGVLSVLTTYTFRARHRGTTYGASAWVSVVANTKADFCSAYDNSFDDGSDIDGLGCSVLNYDAVTDTGYYGEVSSATLITGDQLAAQIGLTAGTSINSTAGWLKFYVGAAAACNRHGAPYVLYVAKKPIRHTVSWDDIYARGAVYGTGDNGLYPTGTATTQDASVTIGGKVLDVKLLTGANADPFNITGLDSSTSCSLGIGNNSEWNDLVYRIHQTVVTCGSTIYDGGSQVGANWANLTNADIVVSSGDGRLTWCQETVASDTTRRVFRGSARLSSLVHDTSSISSITTGFRPALRLS